MRRKNFLPFFIVFFALSLLLIFFGEAGLFGNLSSFLNNSSNPIRSKVFNVLTLSSFKNSAIEKLTLENRNLQKRLVDQENLINENKALKDQFVNPNLEPSALLPAKVVGAPGFIPGVSQPDYLIINKGFGDQIKVGSTAVVGNYLVGKVVKVSGNFSKVELVTARSTSFTAKVKEEEGINGIIKGEGDKSLTFGNILLSQNLKKDQIVLTKGEKDENGVGFPPDLIVGKVTSIEKKSSELFQKAEVESFVNFINLNIVFVIR